MALVHGTRSCYIHMPCRCRICKDANAKYHRDKVAYYRSLSQSEDKHGDLSSISDSKGPAYLHGKVTTYDWYQCRCQECRQAVAVKRKRYRM